MGKNTKFIQMLSKITLEDANVNIDAIIAMYCKLFKITRRFLVKKYVEITIEGA